MKTAIVAMTLGVVVASPSDANHKCSTNWSQCNGQNWPYNVCCEDSNFQCNYKNQYLSLCEPKSPETPKPDDNNKQCSTNWSQCNGQNWPHGVCCQDPNFQCNYKSQYLSLCEPKTQQAMEAEDANHRCSTNWSQCNGQNWPYNVCCEDHNFQCNYKNQYLSLCEPKKKAMDHGEDEHKKKCSTNWSQCNGQNWPFGVCCQDPGFQCNYKNQYLSLCEPKTQQAMDVEVAQVDVWGQCGGNGYNGDKTCADGTSCVVVNDWYWQCQPTPPKDTEFPTWAQCGGSANGFSNPSGKTCRSADQCKQWNDFYSQCIPK